MKDFWRVEDSRGRGPYQAAITYGLWSNDPIRHPGPPSDKVPTPRAMHGRSYVFGFADFAQLGEWMMPEILPQLKMVNERFGLGFKVSHFQVPNRERLDGKRQCIAPYYLLTHVESLSLEDAIEQLSKETSNE